MIKKKSLLNYCGLLGVAAFLSYTAAVVFSPLAYPGYDWMAQAVSDLSASNAPSLRLWNQLSSLYNACTLVCAMMVCIGIQGKKNRLLQVGIKMHIFSTVIVVLLSIVSLVLIIIAGAKDKSSRSYGIFAAIALGMNCLRQQAEICLDIPRVIHREILLKQLLMLCSFRKMKKI